MNGKTPGFLVVAQDRENDPMARRFAVCISNVDEAVYEIARRIPELSCFSERPLTEDEIRKLGLQPGQMVPYDSPQTP
jgi:hypothetical protein